MRVIKLDCGDIVFTGEGENVYSVNEKHVCLKCAVKSAIRMGLINGDNLSEKDIIILKEKYNSVPVDEYVLKNPWADISKMSISKHIS